MKKEARGRRREGCDIKELVRLAEGLGHDGGRAPQARHEQRDLAW